MSSMHDKWKEQQFSGESSTALAGVKVLDLSRLVAGNMTSLQLGDFGADVVKVEPLPTGDPLRAWQNQGVASFWKVYGRNKRSLALDFRREGAVELLRELIAGADVLIENFRPGTLEKMGLAPDTLCSADPSLIVLRVSGFGQSGPYSSRPGFGTVVEGMSGFADRNGEAGGGPLLPPLALADMIAGIYGAFSTVTALRVRDQTGHGQVIDLSLLEPIISTLGPEALDFALTQAPKPRVGNGSNTSSPRNIYRTADGGYIAISGSMQSMAERLFKLMQREDLLEDPRYATNAARVEHRHEVDAIVGEWVGRFDREDLVVLFQQEHITASPIYDIAAITGDSHFIERGVYVRVPDEELGSVPMHAPVPRLSGTPGTIARGAPALGADSRAILADYGFSAERIEAAVRRGVIGERTQ
ncbi:CaiB/BaiF CoA transferase family protein [Salinicola halophyticus]|uniref:CaiB/BaiF CoA transferase family protein n=1 Tax=Salinicola halophyticus TaxID=1808881 RepID=UPI003F471D14